MKNAIAIALLTLCGCASLVGNQLPTTDAGNWPRPLSNAEVRREMKACQNTGMVPDLVKEQGRVVWVQCWPPKGEPAP